MKIAVEKRYCGQKHVSKFHQHPSFTCNVSHPNAIINESKDLNGPSTFHGKKYFGSLFFFTFCPITRHLPLPEIVQIKKLSVLANKYRRTKGSPIYEGEFLLHS